MRKVLMAVCVLFLMVGVTLAAPVRFVKYDEKTKEVTVKEGKKGEEKEKTYKITEKTKFFNNDKEMTTEDGIKKFTAEKAVKGFDLESDADNAVKIKFLPKKKKDPS